jgi:hypothetical protein
MSAELDSRLRAAGDALQRSAAPLSPSTPRPRSLRPVAAAAAGVLVVVVVAGLAIRDGQPDEAETLSLSPSPVVPQLLPEVLPEGFLPGGAVELAEGPDASRGAVTVDVYGDPTADDPFAATDLAIYTGDLPFVGDQLNHAAGGDPVTVRGHQGHVEAHLGDGVLVVWEESPGLTVGIASWSLDRAQLLAIAEGLDVDPAAPTIELGLLPDGLAGTLAAVGSAEGVAVPPALTPLGVAVPAFGNGHLAYYRTDDYLFPGSVAAATFAGEADALAVTRWLSAADTAADVRGRAGWAGSYQLPPWDDGEGIVPESEELFVTTVVWEEEPGVVALVQRFGHGDADALALAESLRPATPDEWARLLHLGASDDKILLDPERSIGDRLELPMPGHALNGAEGVYGASGSWATWLLPDGALCGAVNDDAAEPVVTCDPEGRPVIPIRDRTGRPVLVIGVMPDGAVGRIAVDGEIAEAQTVTGPDSAPPYYVLTIAGEAVPSAITFVADDGTDLATVPVAR